jgi:acetolactate synthase small subunit
VAILSQSSSETEPSVVDAVTRVRFVIEADNRGDVPARVVILFHRLNVEIDRLHLVREHDAESMRMTVTVRAEREHARRLEAHLYKVVSVRSVVTKKEQSKGRR